MPDKTLASCTPANGEENVRRRLSEGQPTLPVRGRLAYLFVVCWLLFFVAGTTLVLLGGTPVADVSDGHYTIQHGRRSPVSHVAWQTAGWMLWMLIVGATGVVTTWITALIRTHWMRVVAPSPSVELAWLAIGAPMVSTLVLALWAIGLFESFL